MGLSNLQKLGTIVSQLPFLRETPEFSSHKEELDDVIYRLKEILYSAENKEKEIAWFKENVFTEIGEKK
jgi:hypothetical protein